ncbi:hypothetical protein LCGC14_2186370, partial [marine sediment metagenome]
MVTTQKPNPVVINVNVQGMNLIKAVCNAALKQSGMEALTVVNLILSNMKGLAPPQLKAPEKEDTSRT